MNIGVAAHITAASEGGKRYESSLSADQRRSAGNGIWLCQNCGKLIDNDDVRYTVQQLQEWKTAAEASAALALERRAEPLTNSQGVFLQAERLMPDLIREMRQDVAKDTTELVREFFVFSDRRTVFNSDKQRFRYFISDHPNLKIQIDWLDEMGAIIDVTPGSTPTYRLLPEFADWLRSTA